MVDLTERVGLPVKLVPAEEGWQLEIGEGVLHEKPAVRLVSDLKPVMKKPERQHASLALLDVSRCQAS
jgi:hypothetical protein